MERYSLGKNAGYMLKAFHKPRQVIEFFLRKPSRGYSTLPLGVFTTMYVFSGILSYIYQQPLLQIPRILPVSDADYRFHEIFFFSAVHVSDFFVSGAAILVASKLLKVRGKVSLSEVIVFLMFDWNTIGLVGAFYDTLGFTYWTQPLNSLLQAVVHSICGFMIGAYLVWFVHRHAGISRKMALAVVLPAFIIFLGFRMIFIR